MQTSLGGRIGHALSVFTAVWHAPYTCVRYLSDLSHNSGWLYDITTSRSL